MRKCQSLLFTLKPSYICCYIIRMTLPLRAKSSPHQIHQICHQSQSLCERSFSADLSNWSTRSPLSILPSIKLMSMFSRNA